MPNEAIEALRHPVGPQHLDLHRVRLLRTQPDQEPRIVRCHVAPRCARLHLDDAARRVKADAAAERVAARRTAASKLDADPVSFAVVGAAVLQKSVALSGVDDEEVEVPKGIIAADVLEEAEDGEGEAADDEQMNDA